MASAGAPVPGAGLMVSELRQDHTDDTRGTATTTLATAWPKIADKGSRRWRRWVGFLLLMVTAVMWTFSSFLASVIPHNMIRHDNKY